MGFIFEKYEPFLGDRTIAVVHFNGNNNGTGVDFIGLLHILQLALFFELTHRHQCKIHQADKLIRTVFKDLCTRIQIALVGFFHRFPVKTISECDIFQFSGKRRMTAVVRPVGIQHTDLRHGRISLFLACKILLDMLEILQGHRKTKRIVQLF